VHVWEIAHRPAEAELALAPVPASADFRGSAQAVVLHVASSSNVCTSPSKLTR
jgi:hypothetical protein